MNTNSHKIRLGCSTSLMLTIIEVKLCWWRRYWYWYTLLLLTEQWRIDSVCISWSLLFLLKFLFLSFFFPSFFFTFFHLICQSLIACLFLLFPVSCIISCCRLNFSMLLLIHSLFQSILVLLFPSLFLPSSLTQIYCVMFPMHFSSFFLSFFLWSPHYW